MSATATVGSKSSRVDWRAEALVFVLATAEAAVVWLVADLALAAPSGEDLRLPVAAVVVLIYLGTGLPRWLEALDVWERGFGIAVSAAVVLSTLFAIKLASFPQYGWSDPEWVRQTLRALVLHANESRLPVWGMIAISAYAWWRGKTRAEPGPDSALMTLRIGTAAVLVAAAAQASVREGGASGATSGAVVVFFAAALASIAVARWRANAVTDGSALGTRWLGSMLAPVLAVTVGAIVVAGILSRDLLDTILWFLAPLIWALSVFLRIVILLMALIAFLLVSPILWLLSRHPINVAGIQVAPTEIPPDERAQRVVDQTSQIPDPIRYLIAAAILLILFTGVTRLALRRRRKPPAAGGEERSSVLDTGDLWGLLKSLLAARLHGRPAAVDPLAGLRGDPQWAHTVVIRDTYGRYLRWSRDRGLPRRAETTPIEHERVMAAQLRAAEERGELERLIGGYNAARYGEDPATAEQAKTVRDAWRRLQAEEK